MLALLSRLLAFSVAHRWLVVVLALAVGALGVYNFNRLPIDAVPDITNVQVQINTQVKALSPVEVERQVTFPIEWSMGGIPRVQQVRSLSRYGLSQVTVIRGIIRPGPERASPGVRGAAAAGSGRQKIPEPHKASKA